METVSLPIKWRRARLGMSTVAVVAALGAATAMPSSAAARAADDGSGRPPRPPVADAVGFSNGSFEIPALPPGGFLEIGEGQPTQTLGPWTVIRGNVDLATKEFWQTADGNQSVDLSGDQAGTIEQIFPQFQVRPTP